MTETDQVTMVKCADSDISQAYEAMHDGANTLSEVADELGVTTERARQLVRELKQLEMAESSSVDDLPDF